VSLKLTPPHVPGGGDGLEAGIAAAPKARARASKAHEPAFISNIGGIYLLLVRANVGSGGGGRSRAPVI
jgi:hypothetical protein